MSIRKVNIPKPNGQQEQTNIAPAVEQITDYLPAVGDEVNGYTVGAVVDFIKGLKLGGVVIDIDTDGNIRFNGNIYATGFVSAMGAGTSDGGTASGGGLDEDELWRILAGDANSRQILSQYLITALTPYLLTSSLQMLTIKRGGVTIGTYKADTAKSINIELPTFAEVLNKPTTLAGYGITDAMTTTAINSSINAVSSRVDTAQATAEGAVTAVNNLQIGGRNILYNSAFNTLQYWDNSAVGSGYQGYNSIVNTAQFMAQVIRDTQRKSLLYNAEYITLSCYYKLTGTSGSIFIGVQAVGGSRYTIPNTIADGDWHYASMSFTPTKWANYKATLNPIEISTRVNSGTTDTVEISRVKLELGNKATDWTPAPEDVEEEISKTKTDIVNGNVASATKLQTARSLWGNSFDGTKDINGTIKFANGANGKNIWINGDAVKIIEPIENNYAFGMELYNHDGTTAIKGAVGFYGSKNNNEGYRYSYIGDTYSTNNLRVWKGGNVTIGRDTNTGYQLDVNGTIKGTTAFLGRLMIGYTTEDTNYSIKCDGRFYAGDDSEICGLLTVDSLVASDNIKGQSLTILGSASITDLSCNLITSNTIKANIGIESSGYVSAMASSASDGRFKTDVQDFNSLSMLQRLTFVAYRWRSEAQLISSELHDNTTNYGVIAQDADGIIDGLVYDAKTQAGTIKAVRYEKLIPIIAKGVQELNDEVTILRAENAKLRAEIDEIKRQIKRLWNRQF